MKIYTKFGDEGKTFLPNLGKVDKSHILIEAIGKIDELNCQIGLLHTHCTDNDQNKILLSIQKELFMIGAYLADNKTQTISSPQTTTALEKNIDKMTDILIPLNKFILPGGSLAAAQAHLCRSVCRTVERRLVSLNQNNLTTPDILIWTNRLSDYFFTLARFLNHINSKPDITWSRK